MSSVSSQLRHSFIYYAIKHIGIIYVFLCLNIIIIESVDSYSSIFGNDGLCCKSPDQCNIQDCGFLNLECCRLQDEYICDPSTNYTTPNIYHGQFKIYNDNFYFRLYPDYIYFEYELKSKSNAIGLSWNDYNHPYPNLHFTFIMNNNNNWNMFDILSQRDNYTIYPPNINDGDYPCRSQSGYCLSTPVLNFNYQTAYNQFNFVCIHCILYFYNDQIFVQQRNIKNMYNRICICY